MSDMTRHRFLVFACIGLGVMVQGMLWSMVNLSLASIQDFFHPSFTQLQWIMNGYGLGICIPLLGMGKLGDLIGAKNVFLIGLVGILIACLIGGLASSVGHLIFAMVIFGISGSAILPLSQALLVHQFPENEKKHAVGIWSIFCSLALALGPLLGGIILSTLGWRYVFLINVPFLIAIIPIFACIMENHQKPSTIHSSWWSVLWLAGLTGFLVFGLMQGPSFGWITWETISVFVVAACFLTGFIITEKRVEFPLFRPDLFLNRAFLLASSINAILIGFIWVSFFMIPLFLQNVERFGSFGTGAMMMLITIPVAFLSSSMKKFYVSDHVRRFILTGIGFLIISTLLNLYPHIITVTLSCLFLGFGWVVVWNASITKALESIPHEIAGKASGMFVTIQEMGGVITLALSNVIFQTILHTKLAPVMGQITEKLSALPPEKQNSLLANPTALEKYLGKGSELLNRVTVAFSDGYIGCFILLLILCLTGAILCSMMKQKKAIG